MNGFIKFMELYGINYITTAVIAFLGILIVRNILKLIKKGCWIVLLIGL